MNESRVVISNQSSIHENLETVIRKHLATPFNKPFADHSRREFDKVNETVHHRDRPLILDAGCGTGDSSRKLAKQFPDHLIIGVDKSAHRITKLRGDNILDNLILVRADLIDFYRLVSTADWQVTRHYILYPNPWPKSAHFQRRWHGSPVFPDIVNLGSRLELRTNWQIYAEEFAAALEVAGRPAAISEYDPQGNYMTLFEEKYAKSNQKLWRVTAHIATNDNNTFGETEKCNNNN